MGSNSKSGDGGKVGKNGGGTESLLSAFDSPTEEVHKVGWDEASPETMHSLVESVVACGGALMFGRSRQGDVLSITVFLNGDKRTRWVRPEEDPDTVLEALALPFEATRE